MAKGVETSGKVHICIHTHIHTVHAHILLQTEEKLITRLEKPPDWSDFVLTFTCILFYILISCNKYLFIFNSRGFWFIMSVL